MRNRLDRAFASALLGLAAIAPGSSRAATAEEKPAETDGSLTPKQIIERMTASPVQYRINDVTSLKDTTRDEFPTLLWPLRVPVQFPPKVSVNAKGQTSLTSETLDKKAQAQLERAEAFYAGKDYAQALEAYSRLESMAPESHLGALYSGDCHFMMKEYEPALAAYDRAVARKPDDYTAHFFRGDALYHLGRARESRASFIQALALKPHHEAIESKLKQIASGLDSVFHGERFVPEAFVRREEEAIAIYFSLEGQSPAWLAWANCKAYWLGDPDYAKSLVSATASWSSREDHDCILNLLAVYAMQRDEGAASRDEGFDRIRRIMDDGYLTEYVVYEFGSRVIPNIPLLMPAESRTRLQEFVSRYVLVAGSPEAAQLPGSHS